MAIFRTPPPAAKPLECRKLKDFPNFVEAETKLKDLQRRHQAKEREYKVANEIPSHHRPDAVEFGARELLGGATTIATPPDVSGLYRECQTLRRAVELQDAEVNRQRGIAARGIASDLASAHRAIIADYIDKQKQANAAYDSLLAMRQSATMLCGVECLPNFAVVEHKRTVYLTNFREFEQFTAHYVQTGDSRNHV